MKIDFLEYRPNGNSVLLLSTELPNVPTTGDWVFLPKDEGTGPTKFKVIKVTWFLDPRFLCAQVMLELLL